MSIDVRSQRFVVKVAGESGQGVNSVGEIIAKSLKETGYQVFGYREYPSLIKGGHSSYQIDISDQPLSSSSEACDLLLCLSRVSVHAYLSSVRQGGQLLHTLKALNLSPEEKKLLEDRQITVEYVDAVKMATDLGGTWIMANTVVIGILLQLLKLSPTVVTRVLEAEFAHKPAVLTVNQACLQAGLELPLQTLKPLSLTYQVQPALETNYLLTGNHALALGAVAAGVRAYYSYPMTPASSILTFLADWAHETGMLVKQIEDEISVAQMTIGSMFMGTRALCGTSGGGFDLMTESVSMAGMTETPFVCILGQRPGPATGLPTWTGTGDLNLAVYAGHGEFARCVLAASDVSSAFRLVGEAFNLAEKYQTPVIILTEKQIAESLYQVGAFPDVPRVERSLVPEAERATLQSSDRYALSESGISKRWLPGQSPATFDANSDEHLPDGSLTEDAIPAKAMYEKRLRKQAALATELPEPTYYGHPQPDWVMIGWGSVKGSILDSLQLLSRTQPNLKFGYLHYEVVYPVKTELFEELTRHVSDRMILVENNYLGQLGALLEQKTTYRFSHRLLKYDGRPFFVEDIMRYIEEHCH